MTAALFATAAGAQPAEIGYERGSLGFEALANGDLGTAEAQIESAQVAPNDPARLINLGYIHMRTGRIQSAQRLFEAARAAPAGTMLVLANGEIVDARAVAGRALRRLTPALATR